MDAALFLLATLVLATGCVTGPAPAPAPAARPHERDDADAALELAVYDLVNAHRRDQGLPPLTLDARINRLARLHSAAMAARKVRVGHDGFAERAAILGQGGPRSIAENVAYDVGHADPATEIVQGWLRSRGHRENIEGPYDRTGIGAARTVVGEVYVTQLFVGSAQRTRDSPEGSRVARAPSEGMPGRANRSIRRTSRRG